MPVLHERDDALAERLRREFSGRFDAAACFAVRAPGRVNLIGEHTDYTGGLVLPCAIDRHTVIVGATRADTTVRVHSREASGAAEPSSFSLDVPLRPAGDWLDYVRGAFQTVAAETGRRPPGLDLAIASDVPGESGLSSSAALGVALVTALERALGLSLSPAERGRLAHRSERDFVGVPCGIMDQYASALGRRDHALRLDCRSLAVEFLPLPGERVRLLVAHSGVRRRLAAGGYGDRAAECEAAHEAVSLAFARAGRAEPEALRDVAPADLPALEAGLQPLLFRRLRHVVTENQRVEDFCDALAREDFAAAGRLLEAGMASLRDDFEVSVPELDHLCALGRDAPGVYGSRLTGAGFGGCTVHLVDSRRAASAAAHLAAGFEARFGRRPPVFEIAPAEGASILA
jgi:galactokinase